MGTRVIGFNQTIPTSVVAGNSSESGTISLNLSSTGEAAFPEELHHSKVLINDHESLVPVAGWSGPHWSKEITGVESGEKDIKIDWIRSYTIDEESFSLIKQSTDQVCWSAAAAIIVSFRDGKSYTIDSVLNMLDGGGTGGFHDLFNANKTIGDEEMLQIGATLGFTPVTISDLSASTIFNILKNCGPILSIVNIPDSNNARHTSVINGVYDTGGADSCINYIEVADGCAWHYVAAADFFGIYNQMWVCGDGLPNRGTLNATGKVLVRAGDRLQTIRGDGLHICLG
jgi:hypothetical protein